MMTDTSATKRAMVVAGMAMAIMGASAPAFAQEVEPIRVGILDLSAKKVIGVKDGVTLEYREFTPSGRSPGAWKTPAGPDHGEIVTATMIAQFRKLDRHRPIRIYAANAFGMKEKDDGSIALSFDFQQGVKALNWMHDQGVRIVVTAFNSKNEQGSAKLMDEAERLGMIVFAGAPNTPGVGKVFPAADPRSVSVVDSGPDMALRKDASIAGWVRYAMDGTVITGTGAERSREIGSSYASAKAGAYGAYVVSKAPKATADQIRSAMDASATPSSYQIKGVSVTVSEIGGVEGDRRLQRSVEALADRDSRDDVQVATLAAMIRNGSPQR